MMKTLGLSLPAPGAEAEPEVLLRAPLRAPPPGAPLQRALLQRALPGVLLTLEPGPQAGLQMMTNTRPAADTHRGIHKLRRFTRFMRVALVVHPELPMMMGLIDEADVGHDLPPMMALTREVDVHHDLPPMMALRHGLVGLRGPLLRKRRAASVAAAKRLQAASRSCWLMITAAMRGLVTAACPSRRTHAPVDRRMTTSAAMPLPAHAHPHEHLDEAIDPRSRRKFPRHPKFRKCLRCLKYHDPLTVPCHELPTTQHRELLTLTKYHEVVLFMNIHDILSLMRYRGLPRFTKFLKFLRSPRSPRFLRSQTSCQGVEPPANSICPEWPRGANTPIRAIQASPRATCLRKTLLSP